jgi:hypothetical protein
MVEFFLFLLLGVIALFLINITIELVKLNKTAEKILEKINSK